MRPPKSTADEKLVGSLLIGLEILGLTVIAGRVQLHNPRIFSDSQWCCNCTLRARFLFASNRFPKTQG